MNNQCNSSKKQESSEYCYHNEYYNCPSCNQNEYYYYYWPYYYQYYNNYWSTIPKNYYKNNFYFWPNIPLDYYQNDHYYDSKQANPQANYYIQSNFFGNDFENNDPENIRKEVSKTYSKYAEEERKCNCKSNKYAISLGYSEEDLANEDSIVGNLSCGNPVGLADIKKGESVMDLGCGKGFDCRLASKRVGESGKVVGVDMTKEMIEQAIKITKKEKYPNVEYELSNIEDLEKFEKFKEKFDVVISNCVFNLSPEKEKVLKGVYYSLKKGGRLIFTDPIALKPIPDEIRKDMKSYTSCMANASLIEDLNKMLISAGFKNIRIEFKNDNNDYIKKWTPETKWEDGKDPKEYVTTGSIFAYKST